MHTQRISYNLLRSAGELSKLSRFFAFLVKEGHFDPDEVILNLRDALSVLKEVVKDFTQGLEEDLARELGARGGEPQIRLRVKHLAGDLEQLGEHLEDLLKALEFLKGLSVDDPNAWGALLGLKHGLLVTFAFAAEGLTVIAQRLSALAEFHKTGEVLGEDTDRTDLWLEEALARYDNLRPEDILYAAPEEFPREPREPRRPSRALRCSIVPVMFATDRRRRKGSALFHADYRDGRGDGRLTYGVAEVSIPRGRRHRIGRLERPSLWRLQFREDPEKHIVILRCQEMKGSAWKATAKERIAEADASEALIFIHGFNTSFADAIRRAAQIGYDLQFPGLISAFSWCSQGKVLGYATDYSNARLAVPHLVTLLRDLRDGVGVKAIHIIAHSMGNVVLLEALRKMRRQRKNRAVLDEVVLAAPDYDADELRAAARELKGKARRYTLYGSEKDRALVLSKRLRSNYPRAGDGGSRLLLVDGVESIDATAAGEDLLGLGHSYFSSQRTVLSDIFYVIRESLPPHGRMGLEENQRAGARYWTFIP